MHKLIMDKTVELISIRYSLRVFQPEQKHYFCRTLKR